MFAGANSICATHSIFLLRKIDMLPLATRVQPFRLANRQATFPYTGKAFGRSLKGNLLREKDTQSYKTACRIYTASECCKTKPTFSSRRRLCHALQKNRSVPVSPKGYVHRKIRKNFLDWMNLAKALLWVTRRRTKYAEWLNSFKTQKLNSINLLANLFLIILT